MRLLRYMTELRTIVHSVTSSIRPLLSTVVVLALVIYVTSIYFTQVVSAYHIDAGAANPEFEEYFGTVSLCMIALFQTVTGGAEWRDMVMPLMEHISPFMGLVFSSYIVFTI